MTIESIIGITSGIIGIGGFLLTAWKTYEKLSLANSLERLTNKNFSTKRHRRILKWINFLLIGHPISKKYIQDFVLSDRGKEAVFMDICEKNNIEPTKEICVKFLKADMPKFRKEYQSKKKAVTPLSNNKGEKIVYMSDLLKERYPETCNRLLQILDKYHVTYDWIKGTKDIWCRDYMPVQTESGKFIQFRYEPSYLKGRKEWEESRSDVKEICRINNIDAAFSDINLDGGNVLICDGRAIISDRLFSENPERDKDSLLRALAKLLECEIIIIPALKSQDEDLTGHADGMVRFVDRNTIIGNERRADEYKYMKDGLQKALDTFNLTYIDIPYFVDNDAKHPYSAIGIYVNYLEVNDLIVFPVFGEEKTDQKALEIIKKSFPNKQIETINYNDIAKEGGLLNCTTWCIRV